MRNGPIALAGVSCETKDAIFGARCVDLSSRTFFLASSVRQSSVRFYWNVICYSFILLTIHRLLLSLGIALPGLNRFFHSLVSTWRSITLPIACPKILSNAFLLWSITESVQIYKSGVAIKVHLQLVTLRRLIFAKLRRRSIEMTPGGNDHCEKVHANMSTTFEYFEVLHLEQSQNDLSAGIVFQDLGESSRIARYLEAPSLLDVRLLDRSLYQK